MTNDRLDDCDLGLTCDEAIDVDENTPYSYPEIICKSQPQGTAL